MLSIKNVSKEQGHYDDCLQNRLVKGTRPWTVEPGWTVLCRPGMIAWEVVRMLCGAGDVPEYKSSGVLVVNCA